MTPDQKRRSRESLAAFLAMEFDREVGDRKGSWKGGTTGHSIEMLPTDSPEWAFRRYCAANRLFFLCRMPNEAYREPPKSEEPSCTAKVPA